MLLLDEYAHHVVFQFTGFRASSEFDWFEELEDFHDCIEFSGTPEEKIETSFVEAITDAVAAQYSG